MFQFKVERKNFKVDVDLDDLLIRANALKDSYEEDMLNLKTELRITKEEYEFDICKLINYIQCFKDNSELLVPLVINVIGKKKDGWLAKGRVHHIVICENTARDSEEEYGYRAWCLRTKNTSADTVLVELKEDIFKW